MYKLVRTLNDKRSLSLNLNINSVKVSFLALEMFCYELYDCHLDDMLAEVLSHLLSRLFGPTVGYSKCASSWKQAVLASTSEWFSPWFHCETKRCLSSIWHMYRTE